MRGKRFEKKSITVEEAGNLDLHLVEFFFYVNSMETKTFEYFQSLFQIFNLLRIDSNYHFI